MSAIKILKIRSRDTDPDSLPYKKIRLSDKEERDLSLAMDSLDHLIDIHKDKSNSLYNLITSDLLERSYLDFKSVSVYITDNKSRVLLHKEYSDDCRFPDESHIVPILGSCYDNEMHKDAACRTLKSRLNIDVPTKDLKPIWGNTNGNHIAYLYCIPECFEDFEKRLVNPRIGVKKKVPVRRDFESSLLRRVYYCTFLQMSYLDNEYTISSSKWIWTLHRPNGCMAVYNVFQWLRKIESENYLLNANKYSETCIVNERFDQDATSTQNLIWSIINNGLFENSFFHLGKIGCSILTCEKYKMHKYVPINSMPFYEEISEHDLQIYCNNPEYNKNSEKNYSNNVILLAFHSMIGNLLRSCKPIVDKSFKNFTFLVTN